MIVNDFRGGHFEPCKNHDALWHLTDAHYPETDEIIARDSVYPDYGLRPRPALSHPTPSPPLPLGPLAATLIKAMIQLARRAIRPNCIIVLAITDALLYPIEACTSFVWSH